MKSRIEISLQLLVIGEILMDIHLKYIQTVEVNRFFMEVQDVELLNFLPYEMILYLVILGKRLNNG